MVAVLDYEVGKWTLVTAVVIFAIGIVAAKMLKRYLDLHFTSFRHALHIDTQRYRFLKHFLVGMVVLIGLGFAVYMIPALRAISVSIFAGAGVLAIVVGFAAQKALGNVISGVFIAVSKPYRVGDWITIGERYGTVEDITLRHTVIRNPRNERIIIPNSIIGDEVIENSTIHDKRLCKWLEFHISYDADIDKARRIMEEEVRKHPDFLDVRSADEKKAGQPVRVKIVGFGDSSVILRAWAWVHDIDAAYRIFWDLNESIKKRFDREGVEIPFPYRTLVYKKDLA